MAEELNVVLRNELGTRAVRRLRKAGVVPAVLYGHKKECVHLSISNPELRAILRHGGHLVDLVGDVTEKALIKRVQWDTFTTHVLHLDLTRVSEQEHVTVTVPLELRGEAPGTKQGGIVEHLVYKLEIECPAGAIPEKLTVHLNSLELGDTLTAAAAELPDNVKLVTPPERVVAHCLAMGVEEEEEQLAAGTSEPEVIGRKPEDGEDNEASS